MPSRKYTVKNSPRLLAVGGGGFSQQCDPVLDEILVDLLRMENPSIGYIGTANFDNFERLSRFHRRFGELGANTLDLPTRATLTEASQWLANLDALYVSGGKTRHLLNHWRTTGQDSLLKEAANDGLLLSGVSAGAVCWFEFALSESSSGARLHPLECLGIFKGSCCPHYNTEPARPPAFEQHIAEGALPDGVAIDDGAAVLMNGNSVRGVYAARENAGALRVQRVGQKIATMAVPAI